jgi:hypothetical protein
LIRIERINHSKLTHPDLVAKAITQLVFNMGANVIDLPAAERKGSCGANHDYDSDVT